MIPDGELEGLAHIVSVMQGAGCLRLAFDRTDIRLHQVLGVRAG